VPNTRHNLLISILAEVDQQIAKVEDPLREPKDSDQVQTAVAMLNELYELRTILEKRVQERGGGSVVRRQKRH
jgi:hypothetical protein